MKKQTLTDIALSALDDLKAIDIVVFEVSKLTSIADQMIIASGQSKRQVAALADKVIAAAKENGFNLLGLEGKTEGEWTLVDFGDLIVHIMHPETREYYQLEKLWGTEENESTELI